MGPQPFDLKIEAIEAEKAGNRGFGAPLKPVPVQQSLAARTLGRFKAAVKRLQPSWILFAVGLEP